MEKQVKTHSKNSVSATCQNCKSHFTIEPEDFGFYQKIKVPPPTFCPECRLVRRMIATNERTLYKRKCDLTGKEIFSMYPAGIPWPVYETEAWYGDGWDAYKYGRDYDFSRPFFEQFLELQNEVPRMSLVKQGTPLNSPFTHRVTAPKNCYMVFRSSHPENSLYIYISSKIKDCCDSIWIDESELCYECINCERGYNLKYCQEVKDCRDSSFLFACRNCSNCTACVNLVNQKYCIFNNQYAKEDYFKKLKELELGTFSGIRKMEDE